MSSFHIEGFTSFTLAIVLLFLGKLVISRYEFLKRYSVHEPVMWLIYRNAKATFFLNLPRALP